MVVGVRWQLVNISLGKVRVAKVAVWTEDCVKFWEPPAEVGEKTPDILVL